MLASRDKMFGDGTDLPTFDGYEMKREVDSIRHLTFYVDRDGDLWIEDSAGEGRLFCGNISSRDLKDVLDEVYDYD